MYNLIAIFTLCLLGWFWLDSLRAREMALGICIAGCQRKGVQLLDQTVALRKLGVCQTTAGLRFRRRYQFDYSDEGTGRHTGYLVLRGLKLEELSFGLSATTLEA